MRYDFFEMDNIRSMKHNYRIFLILSFFACLSSFAFSTEKSASAEAMRVGGKSAYLMDADSKTEIFSQNADERLPIASMCKIMTLSLCFEAIDEGKLSFDTMIPVSAHASSMGGSQVFLRSGSSYKAEELMKSIAVCSANDSCVAMAEYIAGSDSEFVDRMNEKAKSIGANDTLFANCTGLPKEPQYSTAHDVAYMLDDLIAHEKYFELCSVWNEPFRHPDGKTTDMTNTNKLIRTYQGLDGGKTGFTSEAGFCLASTAKRGDMRVIAVVIGEDTSKGRFQDTEKLFDHAFANFTNRIVLDKDIPLGEKVAVRGGKKEWIQISSEENKGVFSPKGKSEDKISFELVLNDSVKAPVKRGDTIGEIVIFKNGVEYSRVNAVAFEGDERASYGDIVRRTAAEWNF